MSQTGTGKARDKRVLRSRISTVIGTAVPIWWPEDTDFQPPTPTAPPDDPAAFMIVRQGPTFGRRGTVEGSENRSGSWSLIGAVQARLGVDEKMDEIEQLVRGIADVGKNDNAEDTWSMGPIETHENVAPGGLPERIPREAYRFDQFVIPYEATEVGR